MLATSAAPAAGVGLLHLASWRAALQLFCGQTAASSSAAANASASTAGQAPGPFEPVLHAPCARPNALIGWSSPSSPVTMFGRRLLHTSAFALAPQYGGYMRTGQAANVPEDDSRLRILVTGACGQIGTELVPFLRERLGTDNVIASDVKTTRSLLESGPFVYCDVQDKDNLTRIILESGVNYVVHLATLLSAVGERNPSLALRINTSGIQNVLDLAATHNLQVYSPSTIAVFGKTSPRIMTPDDTVMQPHTMYGITKVHSELLGAYYRERYGVDFRSLRYPGIVSLAPPGGGTTDYAVEIFHAALKDPYTYTCFLSEDAALPMMYMPDCLEATWALMMAPREHLTRATYNVTAMSFSPSQLAAAIQKRVPQFGVTYTPDFRDTIAKTWPDSLDDSCARKDWGWQPKYDLDAMAGDMLTKITERMRAKAAAAAAAATARRGLPLPTPSTTTTTTTATFAAGVSGASGAVLSSFTSVSSSSPGGMVVSAQAAAAAAAATQPSPAGLVGGAAFPGLQSEAAGADASEIGSPPFYNPS